MDTTTAIFDSLIILNDEIEGLLARTDFTINELDNPKSVLALLCNIPEDKKKVLLRDQKQFSEYFTPTKREQLSEKLQPTIETFLHISEMPYQVFSLLKQIQDTQIHLDLNINFTVSSEVNMSLTLILNFKFSFVTRFSSWFPMLHPS